MKTRIPIAKEENLFSTYDTPEQMQAILSKNYQKGLKDNAVYHTAGSDYYKNVLPNVSIRDGFNRRDYETFRLDEMTSKDFRRMIAECNNIYRTSGLARNIIELMADFCCQGIKLVHEDPKKEKFFRHWWKKVKGAFVSERFCNYIFRLGTIIIKRSTAKLKFKDVQNLQEGYMTTNSSADINDVTTDAELEATRPPKVNRNEIPWRYNFINPIALVVQGDDLAMFAGDLNYSISIPDKLVRRIKDPQNEIDRRIVDGLPSDIILSVKNGNTTLELDPHKVKVFSYKKDDWSLFADPMLYAVMKDFQMLEKMKLADLAALDGAISHIRLWRLGSMENKILPNPAAISRLSDILINNVGGGAIDLIWGPELDFKETSSDIYKFLGEQKYIPVLNAIYAGLGIPPTLTGAGGRGGYTNNFISLKTLLERLNYVRMLLIQFWETEIIIVQKAMGFSKPAQLWFDRMILSDESSEKNLLVQLVDRGVISYETIRARFGEIPELEALRCKRERQARKKGKMPRQGGPWNNPEQEEALEKIFAQTGTVTPSEVGVELDEKLKGQKNAFDFKNEAAKEMAKQKIPPAGGQPGIPGQGRPKNKKDASPRAKKKVLPRTSAGKFIEAYANARLMQKQISDVLNPVYIGAIGKKDLRSLSDDESTNLEKLSFAVLCNSELNGEINQEQVYTLLQNPLPIPSVVDTVYKDTLAKYMQSRGKEPTYNEARELQASVYALYKGDYDGEI